MVSKLSVLWVFSLFTDFENFYPKEKKEIPKEDEQKSESKGGYNHFLVFCIRSLSPFCHLCICF